MFSEEKNGHLVLKLKKKKRIHFLGKIPIIRSKGNFTFIWAQSDPIYAHFNVCGLFLTILSHNIGSILQQMSKSNSRMGKIEFTHVN